MASFSPKFGSRHAMLLLVGLLFPAIAEGAIPAAEREALIDLYNSTNGAGWTNKTGWLGAAGRNVRGTVSGAMGVARPSFTSTFPLTS